MLGRQPRWKEKEFSLPNYSPDLNDQVRQSYNFWERYSEVTKRQDQELFEYLNMQLDKLPLFGGLFAAVNTAFITLTMPLLSPNPADNTNALLRILIMGLDNSTISELDLPFSPDPNAVLANMLLYMSLCCSLIAAFGALIAQEWLQNLKRTPGASLEGQGRYRQERWSGIKRWRLEIVIQVLPIFLTFSVVLFFPALVLFLSLVSRAVALSVGTFLCPFILCITFPTLAAILDPMCPFQTSISFAARHYLTFACSNLPELRRVFDQVLHRWEGSMSKHSEQRLDIMASATLLRFPSTWGEYLKAVRYILSIGPKTCASVIRRGPDWLRLLALTSQAVRAWRNQPTDESKMIAEHFGAAVYHCTCLLDSSADWDSVREVLPLELFETQTADSNLRAMNFIIHSTALTGDDLKTTEYCLRKSLLHKAVVNQDDLNMEVLEACIDLPYDDVVINLLAVWVAQSFEQPGNRRSGPTFAEMLYSGEQLEHNLAKAVSPPILDKVFSACERTNTLKLACKIYTPFLGKLKDLSNVPDAIDQRLLGELDQSLNALVLSLHRWTTSDDVFLVRFAIVAISTFIKINEKRGQRRLEKGTCEAILSALEYVISGARDWKDEAAKSVLDTMVVNTVQHITDSLHFWHLERLGDRPEVAAYFISSVLSPVEEEWDRWSEWLTLHPRIWIPTKPDSQILWVKRQVAVGILRKLENVKLDDSALHLVQTMYQINPWMGSVWARDLVQNGFIDIIADFMLNRSQHAVQLQYHTLILLLLVWQRTAGMPDVEWATEKMTVAVSRAMVGIEGTCRGSTGERANANFQVEGVDDIGPNSLVNLFKYIKERRGNSALLARGMDAVLRGFGAFNNTPVDIEWDYRSQGNPVTRTMTCSRLGYLRDCELL